MGEAQRPPSERGAVGKLGAIYTVEGVYCVV